MNPLRLRSANAATRGALVSLAVLLLGATGLWSLEHRLLDARRAAADIALRPVGRVASPEAPRNAAGGLREVTPREVSNEFDRLARDGAWTIARFEIESAPARPDAAGVTAYVVALSGTYPNIKQGLGELLVRYPALALRHLTMTRRSDDGPLDAVLTLDAWRGDRVAGDAARAAAAAGPAASVPSGVGS